MFQSRHPAAGMHAAARAVGGCSVYVSDAPGRHDPEILRKLVLPDGNVLRASLPGRPTADCIFADVARDGRTALKIWNRNASTGVIGVFNVQGSWWDRELHQARAVGTRAGRGAMNFNNRLRLVPTAHFSAAFAPAAAQISAFSHSER